MKKKIEHCTNANASKVSSEAVKPATAAVQALSAALTARPARGAHEPEHDRAEQPDHRAQPDHTVPDQRGQVLVVEDDRIRRRRIRGLGGLLRQIRGRGQRVARTEERVGLHELHGRIEVGKPSGADAACASGLLARDPALGEERVVEAAHASGQHGVGRDLLAAQQIKPQARTLAEARGIDCVEVDVAVLKGEREPDLTLFAG